MVSQFHYQYGLIIKECLRALYSGGRFSPPSSCPCLELTSSMEDKLGREGEKGLTRKLQHTLVQILDPAQPVVQKMKTSASHMWQSRIEIEYYSVAYFKRITEFDTL